MGVIEATSAKGNVYTEYSLTCDAPSGSLALPSTLSFWVALSHLTWSGNGVSRSVFPKRTNLKKYFRAKM